VHEQEVLGNIGQAFQPDVRLESLTYNTETSAVPLSIIAEAGRM
jgi:hypothetical protein